MDFSGFKAITFDCYGTLVDWETGILDTLHPILQKRNIVVTDRELLDGYAGFEAALEKSAYTSYRDILSNVMRQFNRKYNLSLDPDEETALADHFGSWKPFPDTPEALRQLQTRYKLAVLSNVDDALFALTAPQLGVTLDYLVTAEQVRSYKPQQAHFHEILRRTGFEREEILHCAQSLFHDIGTARALGFSTIWINRQGTASGANIPATARPDLILPDLASLASLALA